MGKRAAKAAQQMREELARQEAEGTRKPAAVQCPCGTWHTPGHPHTEGDTGPNPKGFGGTR